MTTKEITCREIRLTQKESVGNAAEETQNDSRLNIKIMLEISEKDFATEQERKKNFETRAGSFFLLFGNSFGIYFKFET